LGLKTKDATQNAINMTRVSDVLVKAANESQASVEQFAHALTNKAAAALRNTNKTVEEGVAVLAAYADQGVKGEEAGEKLWMVLRDLQRASLDSKDAWAKLGLSVYDAKGKMRNMGDIVGDLETRLTGMTDKQRRMTFEMLGFQDRSLSAIMSLLGVSEKIKNYEDSLLHAAGVTEQVSNDQLKSFASQLKILWNHVKELGIQIGQVMAPWILKAGEYLKRLTKWFSTVSTSSKQWIIILASVAAAVGPALIALGLMSTAIAGLVLVANPWTLGLLVAAAALASFVYWLSTFGTTAAIVETTIRDLGKANDDLRKGHIDQASRLMQLIEKQSLTNEEQFEAIGLIKDLETVYGPLGVRLDANAKKLVDSIGLQKHLNDLMKEAKLLEKGKEEQEALKNIRAIKKEYADATKFGAMWVDSVLSWENLVGTLTLSGTHQNDMTKHTSDNLTDILNKLSQEEMALQKIRKETDAIYEAANKGDQGALNDVLTGVPAEVGKKVREQLEEIAKAKAKADAAMQENQWGAYVDEFFVGETDLAQAIENVTTKLHAQIDAYKQGHAAVMVAQLARKGATEEQLKPARDLLATLKEMELASAVDKIKEETKYMKEKGHELQRLKFIEQGYTDIQLTAFDDATRAFDLKQKDLELQAEADALIKKYTPKVVLLAAAQEKLDQMLKENKITLAQYNMAIEDIQKEIDAANKKDKLDLSPTNVTAVEKDSAEALRMFYEYMRDRRKINDAGNAQQIKDAQKTAAAVAAASTPPGATAPTMPSTTDPTAPLTEKQKRAQRRAAGYGPTGTKTWWQLANDKGRVHSRTESARRDQREEAAELRRGGRVAYDPLAKMADGPVKTMRLAERERNKRMWPIDSYQKNQAANAAMMAPIRQRTAQRSAAGAAEAARRGAKTPEQYAAARDNRYGGVDMPETRVRLREENLIKSQARRAEEGYNASARQQAEMKVREDFKQKAKGNVQDKEGKWVSPAQQQDKKEKEQQKTLETIAANTDPKNMPRPVVLMPANVRSL
jgi:TP901 family phage tail tape measure protein